MSELDGWIVVRNWEKFQHYRDRQPTWIKLYTELTSNDDWLALSDSERGVLTLIWLEYACGRGVLNARRVATESHWGSRQRNRRRALERLRDAGFIDIVASKPLATVLAQRRTLKSSSKEGASARARSSGSRSRPQDSDRRPTDEEKLEKRQVGLRRFVCQHWDDYPDKSVLMDELRDRGAETGEAGELIEQEKRRRGTP